MKVFSKVAPFVLVAGTLPCAAAAQPPASAEPVNVSRAESERRLVEQVAAVQGGRLITTVETRVTTGRPYSGDAVTETLQVLGDGNRIANKSVTRVFRDNDGRTRREQLGPDGQPRSISINDPVGGTNYTLNPATKTATQSNVVALRAPTAVPPSGFGTTTAQGGGAGGGTAAVTTSGGGGGRARGGAATVTPVTADEEARRREIETARAARVEQAETSQAAAGQAKQVMERAVSGRGTTTREDLGEQTIEGVRARGTRNVTVIPAGSSIGNLNEIRIVSEQWFSPDLEVLVLTRHSDPRVGETVYRLTNIVRAQPDPNLFVLPADYTTVRPRGGRGGGGIE